MADRTSVPNNVYTVLTLIALVALLAGVVYLIMQSNALFGTPLPLNAEPSLQNVPTGLILPLL
ncbi:MAG: hypothetical protein ACE37H_04415 [Phycisphaeraceae bacterium]